MIKLLKSTSIHAVLLSVSLSAYAQTPSQSAIDNARQAGSTIGGQANSTSQQSAQDLTSIFKNTTGMSSFQTTSDPSGKSKTGGATVGLDGSTDFRCEAGVTESSPKLLTAANVRVKVTQCGLNNGAGTVTVRVCTRALTGANTCDASISSHFSDSIELTANTAYSSYQTLKVGVGCASDNMCKLSIKGTYSVVANESTIKNAAATDTSDVVTGLRKADAEGEYAKQINKVGAPLSKCMKQNEEDGVFATCDETRQQVKVNSDRTSAGGPSCTAERICLKEAVQSATYDKVCRVNFPTTERISTYQREIRQCASATPFIPVGWDWFYRTWAITHEGWWWEWWGGSFEENWTNQAYGARPDRDPPMPPDHAFTQNCGDLTGFTLLPGGASSSVRWTLAFQDSDVGPVIQSTKNVTYIKTDLRLLSQEADPPVQGACDASVINGTRYMQCPNGDWFGRTKAAVDCQVSVYNKYTDDTLTRVLEEPNIAGCGYCGTPVYHDICYSQTSVKDTDCDESSLSSCRIKNIIPETYSGDGGGLVVSQQETYSCTTETKQCVEWSNPSDSPSCTSAVAAFGTDKLAQKGASGTGDFSKVMADTAMAQELVKAASAGGSKDAGQITLFAGNYATCQRPGSGLGNVTNKNCCKTSIQRPSSGALFQEGCTEDEAKLAANRRARSDHYLGEWCSRSVKLVFTRICMERTQGYCVFPGILPRLIQEQGRIQLQQMVSGSADAAQVGLNFNYYSSSDTGEWTPVQDANGVKTAAWRWPSYCADPGKAAKTMMENPNAPECAGVLQVLFATCAEPSCESLPSNPEQGSNDWSIVMVNPLENVTSSLSKFSVGTGACNTATSACSYTIKTIPTGGGGRVIVSKELNWSLYSNVATEAIAEGVPSAHDYNISDIGDIMFKLAPLPGMATGVVPSVVPLTFSLNGGASWATANVPTNLKGQEIVLGGSDIRITGGCDGLTNLCRYIATGTARVTNKPWGSARSPDCGGFSIGQLSALDFGKMDLSEWTSTITMGKDVDGPGTAAKAASHVQALNSAYNQTGETKLAQSKPVTNPFARVTPSSGFAPFTVTLTVSPIWPEPTSDISDPDTSPVELVTVDWNDCVSGPVRVERSNKAYTASKTYTDPKGQWAQCGQGAQERDFTHEVKVKALLQNGATKEMTFKVLNSWSSIPGSTSDAQGGNTSLSTTIKQTSPAASAINKP